MNDRNQSYQNTFQNSISAQEWQTLITSFAQAFWETNAQGIIEIDSPSWRAYTGQSPKEWIGEGWVAAVHPEDRTNAFFQWREAIKQGKLVDAEFRIRRPEGHYSWTSVRAAPILNEEGVVKKWIGINIDIEDKKRAEQTLLTCEQEYKTQLENQVACRTQELRENRELLRGTLDSTLEMIQVFKAIRNDKGEIVDFNWSLNNHASEKHYGNVIGKSLLENNPGVKDIGIFETFKRVCETGVYDQSERHYVHEQFDGWFYQSTVKLDDGVVTTTTDITKLKQVQHELATLKEHLQTILDSSPYIIQAFKAERNAQGEIIDFIWTMNNEKGVIQNGDVIGKSLLAKNPGIVETGLFEKFIEVTETGRSVDHEQYYAYEQFEGWFQQVLVKMNDGFVMNTEDITEKKKSQQEIIRLKDEIAQQVTNKYYTIFNSIEEGFCIHELIYEQGKAVDFRWIEVNPAYEKHTGLKDLIGKLASEVMPENESYWLAIYEGIVKTGESVEFENWHQPTGRWYHTFASRISGAENRQVAVLLSDISERKHKENILQESEERQAFLLNLSDVLRSITDPVEMVRFTSELIGKHLGVERVGYGEIETTGTHLTVLQEWTHDHIPHAVGVHGVADLREAMNAAFINGNIFIQEDALESLSGFNAVETSETDCFRASLSVPLMKNGRAVSVLYVQQASPRKWSELEVKLVSEVSERTWAAVGKARAEAALKEADQRKDEFLAMLAHELRNPMATLSNGLQILSITAATNAQARTILERMTHQTDHLVRMVDDLLDVSRISQGKIHIRKDSVNLVEVLRQASESVQLLIHKKQQKLTVTVPDASVELEGDAIRLVQSITNLLTNASRYSGNQGNIHLSLEQLNGMAIIRVKDDGIGLAENQLSNIFELFVQGDHSLARSEGGLGLGLTLVRQIVEGHAGRVEAQSRGLGQGSTFTVWLPVLNNNDHLEETGTDLRLCIH